MEWIYLIAAIAFEVSGTTCMKLSEGFTRWLPSALIFVFYAVSFALLTLALRRIDLSVAYAIWSAVGTAAIALIGVLAFKEPLTGAKASALTVIVIGVVWLNLAGGRGG